MIYQPLSSWVPADFTLACQASRDTNWSSDPANPSQHQSGLIQRGETVWFQQAVFGSGPRWQPARLADNTLCFVDPQDFDSVA